jgi:hydrogenase maturation factor
MRPIKFTALKMKLQSITENRSIQFTGWSSYGNVTVYIGNKKYEYITDAVYHNRWRKLAKHKPWDVLNDIKLQVKNGVATQVQPPPNQTRQARLFS